MFGSDGMLQCYNPPSDSVAIMTKPATMISPAPPSFRQRYEQAYMLELDHFIDVIRDPQKTMRVQKRDTLRAAQLAEACQTSYMTGQVIPFQCKEF